jgi:serine acetyltransferase
MFIDLRADAAGYQKAGFRWYSQSGFWVGANYRFGRWALVRAPAALRKPMLLVHKLVSAPIHLLLTVRLSREAEIGGGLLLCHPHGILVPEGTRIGKGCCLYHEVTLGAGRSAGMPELADGVVVFAGARILGNVKIGAHAEIGANTVVTRDVPAGAVFTVAPARVVPGTTVDVMRSARPDVTDA